MLPRLNPRSFVVAVLTSAAVLGAGCYKPPDIVDLDFDVDVQAATVTDGPCDGGTANDTFCHEIRVELTNERRDQSTATAPERWQASYNIAGGDGPTPHFPASRVDGAANVAPRSTEDLVIFFEVDEGQPLEILRYYADWNGPGVFSIPGYS
jgi:hypothetical protein